MLLLLQTYLTSKTWEQILVHGLDVTGEIEFFAECLTAVRTLMRLFAVVDGSDMVHEVGGLRKFLRTHLTPERPLIGVGSDVTLKLRKSSLTIWTDLLLSLSLWKTSVISILVLRVLLGDVLLELLLSLGDVLDVHVLQHRPHNLVLLPL